MMCTTEVGLKRLQQQSLLVPWPRSRTLAIWSSDGRAVLTQYLRQSRAATTLSTRAWCWGLEASKADGRSARRSAFAVAEPVGESERLRLASTIDPRSQLSVLRRIEPSCHPARSQACGATASCSWEQACEHRRCRHRGRQLLWARMRWSWWPWFCWQKCDSWSLSHLGYLYPSLIITGVVPGYKWPRWLRLQLS